MSKYGIERARHVWVAKDVEDFHHAKGFHVVVVLRLLISLCVKHFLKKKQTRETQTMTGCSRAREEWEN
jgi:hypothetical protein